MGGLHPAPEHKTVAEVLSTKGFEVFLPLHDSMRRWKDRQKVSRCRFPLLRLCSGQAQPAIAGSDHAGNSHDPVRGEQIAVVPEEELLAIRRAVNGNYRVEPHPFLKVGERVRVTRGSLEGVEGILIRKKNLFRLVLSVDMLAQSVGVEVAASDVEPVGVARAKGAFSTTPSAGIAEITNNFPTAVAVYDARLDSTH